MLVLPAMNTSPPTVEMQAQRSTDLAARIARVRLTCPFDMSGSPSLTLPGGFTGNGLPLGFQIIGPDFDEALVLRAGFAFQQTTTWHKQPPPIAEHPKNSG